MSHAMRQREKRQSPHPSATTGRRQLSERVASHLREQILTGEVRPGEFLRIEHVARRMGVSSTPVREGLFFLRSEGFVKLAPRRGFLVAPFTPQDVRDLFWAQGTLGGELAARAARKATSEHLDRLDDLTYAYENAKAEGDPVLLTHTGHLFHREINMAADAPRLALLLGAVVRHLPNRFYTTLESQLSSTAEDHPALAQAVRARDAELARSLMSEHLQRGADSIIERLAQLGVWSGAQETDR